MAEGATTRPCPVCGALEAELIYRQRFAAFTAGSIGDGYDVVSCAACGMCFASGLPAPDRFARYYADSSKYDLGANPTALPERDVERYRDQAAFIADAVADRTTSILDVGTATGGFLAALHGAGFLSVHGVEPSPDAVRVAREVFGLDVRVGGIAEAVAEGQRYDLATYIAVLEHLLTPREQIRDVTRAMDPGGMLFVSVPNAGAFREGAQAPFQEFSVEHINFFTSASLRNLMAAEGYTLVAERTAMLAFGSNGLGPALEAVYRWDGEGRPPTCDSAGAAALREYVELSELVEARVRARIADLAASGDRVYVWGTGTHTLHLLETSRLGECQIAAFLDSNPHYAGATLVGRPVLAPSALAAADAPILVSSSVSQTGIVEAARARFGPGVRLVTLYGTGPG